eukprot:CAMPEP_0172307258 /NCGR_PEP_ID=MMETSP1058-20130122/8148_1 /TAXON_ID=83371 /ORGANISM="Detonula confervacea, Strain CCMP 353" /LENGTH=931 /DNA_ID=CAMNT_0013019371 /DNA_START=12 /DNA_END=2807 /DNA_ORIENTATION=+
MAADLEGVTHGVNGSSGVHLHRRHHDLKSPKSNGNMLLGEQIDQKKTTTRQLLCSGKGSTQLLLLLLAAVLLFNLIMPDAANPDPVNNTNNNATKMNFDQSKSEQSRITSTDNKEKRRDSPIEILASNKGEEEEEAYDTERGVIDVMSNDPRCKLILSASDPALAKAERDYARNKEKGTGPDESFSLSPCHYYYPNRVVPEGGYLKNIDWYLFRPVEPNTSLQREECFVECLALMETLDDSPITEVTHDMLAAAATMGLQNATRVLVNKYKLDPLYLPNFEVEEELRKFQPNAIQAAIMGGYAEVVKILTSSNMELVIDSHGRTVKDYVQMPGSPIRPYYAQKVLGITVDDNKGQSSPVGEGMDESGSITDNSDSGWNSAESVPYSDTTCGFDVIDTTDNDVSLDDFLKNYYLPGRPLVMRNHVSEAEINSFSKRSWSKLDHFHPTSEFNVGVTAYPNLTQQKKCSRKMTIEQLEKDERCAEMKDLHMMHAEHDQGFDEVYAMYDGDPTSSRSGFRKLKEYFDFANYGWQIFFGSDGSGATLHWHAAAFNILYVGKKEWRITPPQYRGFTGMTAQQAKANIENKPYTLKCTQLPGDLIYIPDHWGHMTINHGFGIGVAAIVPAKDRFVPGYTGKEAKRKKRKVVEDANTNYKPQLPRADDPTHDKSDLEHPALRHHPTSKGSERNTIPFFFVHINKTGGTSLISMLGEHCTRDEYVRERWETDSGYNHRSFHSTAHSYLERHGQQVWDQAYTFAVVRHPLARQVSNFFFLVSTCENNKNKCEGDRNDRLIPTNKISASSTEEEKIGAFHDWMWNLYQAYPPGSPEHYLFGSKGHGNEEYSTMNATQTSWLVDETGQDIVVKTILKLEQLSNNGMKELSQAIPCLAKAHTMIAKNQTPKYPHYSKFANNDRTNKIMQEVFTLDYYNFGYDLI